MTLSDFLTLLHPAIAVALIFPLIGITIHRSLQTRQRRLETVAGEKSKVPPTAGREHVQIGKWMAGGVVFLSLLGLAHPIFSHIIENNVWQEKPFQVVFVGLMFAATFASLVLLYNARPKLWRGVFAALTSMGVIILGTQDGIFRRTNEWYVSHYYLGIVVTVLMIISLAIVQEIYQDKTLAWRRAHIALNTIAALLFLGQGLTGPRDLLEIPLSWQKPYVYQLYGNNCQAPESCMVVPSSPPPAP